MAPRSGLFLGRPAGAKGDPIAVGFGAGVFQEKVRCATLSLADG
jgi:hypothetical protein